jgi:hypothetical protein
LKKNIDAFVKSFLRFSKSKKKPPARIDRISAADFSTTAFAFKAFG